MKPLRQFNKDRVGGTLLLVIGLAIAVQAAKYRIGALTHMGAGFVPLLLGGVIAVTGGAIWLTAGPTGFGTAVDARAAWRGWLCILGSVVAFVVLGEHGGLVLATFVSVALAAWGDRANSLRDVLLLATGVTVAGVVLFVYGLKLNFPMFAWG